jgi:S-adenosylmethionine/arginine decarboxylase-like enzyme
MPNNNYGWGQHLLLDLGGCNENVCKKDAIRLFVKELVNTINMKAYGEPIIVHFAEHSYNAVGYSLVQLIETSAITGHFSDNNRDAYLDIFSCKRFEQQDVIQVAKKYFSPQKIHTAFLDRGVDLPIQSPFLQYNDDS